MNGAFHVIELLTASEAAQRLRRSVRTLARMRAEGRGPKFHREGGRVLYSTSEIAEWIAANTFSPKSRDF
jgi:predicted DNA-binding transcriptional regulator AlpA